MPAPRLRRFGRLLKSNTMQVHTFTRKNYNRHSQRIGRGGKRGTYSGRGIKGQKARAGAKFLPAEREILKKIPKLRGHKFKSFRPGPATVNLWQIEKHFGGGEIISPETLVQAGLIERRKGRIPPVKILGNTEMKKKFIFKGVSFSRPAATHTNT